MDFGWMLAHTLVPVVAGILGGANAPRGLDAPVGFSASVTTLLVVWSFYGGVMWGVISIAIVALSALTALRIVLAHKERLRKAELDSRLVEKLGVGE